MSQHKDALALGWIAAIIRWFEDLVNLLSGPLLTVGLGIALVALLTDGQLLARLPILLYVWAISQAVGVDAQLVATWDRARIALREHRYWALVGLIILGAVLAYIAWIAAQVFALQESAGISTGDALSRLGMDPSSWLVQRTALQVFLVALAGWTRYHKPAKDTRAEREELQAELELEPMRNQLRAQQARGVRGAWDALRGKETVPIVEATPAPAQLQIPPVKTNEQAPRKPPTGPGSPAGASKRRKSGVKRPGTPRVVALRSMPAEERIRQAVAERPNISVRVLARKAGVSESTASKHLRVIAAEAAAAQSNDQAVQ